MGEFFVPMVVPMYFLFFDYTLKPHFLCGNFVSFLELLTRFDMEDAMILNKSSVERGLHYGQVYKVLELCEQVLSRLLHLPIVMRFFYVGDDDLFAWV